MWTSECRYDDASSTGRELMFLDLQTVAQGVECQVGYNNKGDAVCRQGVCGICKCSDPSETSSRPHTAD